MDAQEKIFQAKHIFVTLIKAYKSVHNDTDLIQAIKCAERSLTLTDNNLIDHTEQWALKVSNYIKQYVDFVEGQYYTAFVKYGAYCLNTKVIDQEQFTRWLIKNKVKLKDWPTDRMYLLFVQSHCKRESVERALERFVENAMTTEYFETFWETASGYLIADWVEMGKISPWIIITSKRAEKAIGSMTSECIERIANCIDAEYWAKKRQLNPHDANFVQEMIDGTT